MAGRRLTLGSVAAAIAWLLASPPAARAQDPSLSLTYRAIFHGYQLRLFTDRGPDGARIDKFRNVDPLYMTLDLGGHGLGPNGDIETIASIRYRTDFGTGFHRDTPPDVLDPPSTDAKNQLDVILLYADWHDITAGVDVRVGRQVLSDDLDWYPLDGIKATLRVLDKADSALTFEAYVGMPVKLDLLLSSDALLADGYEENDGPGLVFGGSARARLIDDLQLSAAYRQEVVFRGKDIAVFRPAGSPDREAVRAASAGKYGLQEMLLGAGAGYTLRDADLDLYAAGIWNLVFGKADLVRFGVGYNPAAFLHVGGEYIRTWPRFGADSIFNIFNIFPNSRARLEADAEVLRGLHVQAGYFALLFEGGPHTSPSGQTTEFTGSDVSHGPSAGVTYRSTELGFGAGISAEAATNVGGKYAFGGNYRLIEAFGDATFLDGRLGAQLRLGTLTIQNDWFENIDAGRVQDADTSYTLDLGGRAEILEWLHARMNLIKNFGSYLEGSFRVLTMLEVRY